MKQLISDRISVLCNENNITLEELENELNLKSGSILRWENSYPTGDVIIRLAKYFNVTSDFILGLDSAQDEALEMQFIRKIYKGTIDFSIKWESISEQYNEHMGLIAGCIKENTKYAVRKYFLKDSYEYQFDSSSIIFIKFEGYDMEQPTYGLQNILLLVLNRKNLHLRTPSNNFYVLNVSESFLNIFTDKIEYNLNSYYIKNKSNFVMERYLKSNDTGMEDGLIDKLG